MLERVVCLMHVLRKEELIIHVVRHEPRCSREEKFFRNISSQIESKVAHVRLHLKQENSLNEKQFEIYFSQSGNLQVPVIDRLVRFRNESKINFPRQELTDLFAGFQ